MSPSHRPGPLARLRCEDGIGMVEALGAAVLLLVGVLAALSVFDGSRQLVTTSERKEVAVHHAEQELERAASIPYPQLELVSLPGSADAGDPHDPRAWASGTMFDWDAASAGNAAEPLAVKAAEAVNPDAIVPRTNWSDGRFSGTSDTFVSLTANGLKRVTVAVRVSGGEPPRQPTVVSTFVAQAEAS
jgi:hypothetical protein